jgi:hypothetical protein
LPVPLELPVPLAPPGAPLELGDFFGVVLGLVLLEPELPLAPDAPDEELPGEELAPPDADLPPS